MRSSVVLHLLLLLLVILSIFWRTAQCFLPLAPQQKVEAANDKNGSQHTANHKVETIVATQDRCWRCSVPSEVELLVQDAEVDD